MSKIQISHTDSHRRAFLTRLVAGTVALPVLTPIASAQPPDGKGKGGRGKGVDGAEGRRKGGKGPGARGSSEDGSGGRGGRRGMAGDPAEIAKKLIEQFDRDGDKALSLEELKTAMTALQEGKVEGLRGGRAEGRPGGGNRPGGGDRPGGGNRRAKDGEGKKSADSEVGGGVSPARPASE